MFILSQRIKYFFKNKLFLATMSSVFVGFSLAIIVIACFGFNPFSILQKLIIGGFSDANSVTQTLNQWAFFIFLGLAVMLGFKTGLFNIGVSGQITFSLILTLLFIEITKSTWNPSLIVLTSFFIIIISAGLYALIAIILKVFFGAHEVVTTIMLNWIAARFFEFFVKNNNFALDQYGDRLKALPKDVNANIMGDGWNLSWMFFVAIFISLIIFVVMRYTKIGQKIQISGSNMMAAKYAGYNYKKIMILMFLFSGMIAGLASFTYIFSIKNNIVISKYDFISPFTSGFTGIAISLVGMNNAIGILFSSFFFAIFENPAGLINIINDKIDIQIIQIFSAIVIYFVALVNLFIRYINIKNIKILIKKQVIFFQNTIGEKIKQKIKDKTKKEKIYYFLGLIFTFGIANIIYYKILQKKNYNENKEIEKKNKEKNNLKERE